MTTAPRVAPHFGLAAMEGVRRSPSARRVVIRLWLPTTPILLLLAPFVLLFAPLMRFARGPCGRRPFATVVGVGAVLLSLSGAAVEIDSPRALVCIRFL